MNLSSFTQRAISAKFLAGITVVSMLLSALPAAFFVTNAATTGLSLNATTLSTIVGAQVNFVATTNTDDTTLTPGTVISLSDGGNGGEFYTGTVAGACNSATADPDNQFTIGNQKGVCYANNTAGIYTISVDLLDATTTLLATQTVEITVEEPIIICTPQFDAIGTTNIQNAVSGDYFDSINDALADCDTVDGDEIDILGDVAISEEVVITRPITIDGNGNTVTTDIVFGSNSGANSIFEIVGTQDVAIQNLRIDGAGGTSIHGVNIYESMSVLLAGLTIENNDKAGVVVNSSSVEIADITTAGNGWYAINVDKKTSQDAELTIGGVSVHGENAPVTPHIFIDDATLAATVVDVDAQYDILPFGDARVYTLKSEPTEPIVKTTETVIVTGDTAAAENLPGWMFNRDLNNDTPIEFNEDESVLGTGALYVLPISSTDAPRKFIGEYFWQGMIASLDGFSYDFKIGAGGADTDSGEFYLNVYANFAESASDKYYDCKYDVVPTNGTTGAFATVTFDPTQSYPVTTRGGGSASPYTCPAVPADMDNQGVGATIRAFALNTGDTSLSDADLDGYFDNVVLNTKTKVTTFDFEPEEEVVVQPEEPVVVVNTCLLPETANRQPFVPGTSDEKTVQTIFNENGYASVNVNSEQLDTQVWNVSPASTDSVNLTIKVLGKYANNNQAFGYYEAGQSTFVPLFKVGSHSANVPELVIGDSINVSIPVQSINSLGFEQDTEGIDPTIWYSQPDMNRNKKDVLAVYNPTANFFLLAFEDLTEGDNDYNDLVVELADISCVEDEVIVEDSAEESFSTGGSSSRSGGRRSVSSDTDSAPAGSVLGATDTNVDGTLGNGIGGDMPLVQGSQVSMLPVGAPDTGAGGSSSNTPNYVVVLALVVLLLLATTYRPVKA